MSHQEFYETVQREEEYLDMKASAAFVRAQAGFGAALKTSTNPHFRSRYADLSACVEAVIDSLHKNGFALMQKTHECESGVAVETILMHESGEQISGGILRVPASKQDPQGYGSALTYARRYSLMAVCGIAPEDDDGNAASKLKPAEKKMQIPANVGGQDYFDKCDEQERALILDFAMKIEGAETDQATFDAYTKAKQMLDTDQMAALSSKVSSGKRSTIKKIIAAKKMATEIVP
ncbi:MAG: ERF family protein [Burkholderiales bacterium]|nr:ERF family protein [Burkholderiales bacterium]